MEPADLVKTPLSRPPQHISLGWLVLDVAGMSVMGLGFAMMLGKFNPLPPAWQFGGAGLLLVVVGLLCMLPLFWKIRSAIRHVRHQDEIFLNSLPPAVAQALKQHTR